MARTERIEPIPTRPNRFRALRKIWIFDPDPTGFDSDLPEPGEPLYRF